jgi:hypothetical protein
VLDCIKPGTPGDDKVVGFHRMLVVEERGSAMPP